MADFFPPFTPSPGRVSLIGLGLPSPSSAENSPPAAHRSTPSPRLYREQRKALHPLADESDDGCSPHPSIYEASPVASDDECPGDKEPLSVCFETTKPQTADLLSSNPDGTNSPPGGRDLSRFSGLSLLETITEQKSASTQPEERDRESYTQLPTEDDESEDEEFEQCYYEYASPTQPLHPALSTSAPQHTESPYPSPSQSHPTSAPVSNAFFTRGLPPSPRPFPHQPNFRPAVSMNRSYGTLSSHPFHRAPVLTTFPDNYPADNIHTPDSLRSPNSRSRAGSLREGGVWAKISHAFCAFCCCVSVSESER
ncbi:hypothetical protein L873DRAFT_1673276 [Choiromyces venosus 120613-1]|uniref:Uncharacterized protein n=1 Tax=Choiromyces venosus 120613-1 TaxID=1336337 RepID=A0A3N4JW07_9PEZI|nr:hypothetical protein L873DRAFT_1673276 [Choiromyces venosus 120613-1]